MLVIIIYSFLHKWILIFLIAIITYLISEREENVNAEAVEGKKRRVGMHR